MAIEITGSDLSRAPSLEPSDDYPDRVEIRLVWKVGDRNMVRSYEISSAEFFGRGNYGAPLPAEAIVQHIDRMRRQGPPGDKKRKGGV